METDNLLEVIEKILIGGVKIIQHRFKNGNDKENLQEAIKIKKLCKKHNALFIVNDRTDIALASDADGVHLGQDDIDIKYARRLLGSSKIIGITANNSVDIKKAITEGCDYLGIGPVFESSIKQNKKPLGLEKIKDLTKNIELPWFAIGGINRENLINLKKNGVSKVALISCIANSKKPKEEAIMILKEFPNEN
tara:strand:- start:220 stop:801 length:582 start_codon:yes stop_codon:yes gene_type:complete